MMQGLIALLLIVIFNQREVGNPDEIKPVLVKQLEPPCQFVAQLTKYLKDE